MKKMLQSILLFAIVVSTSGCFGPDWTRLKNVNSVAIVGINYSDTLTAYDDDGNPGQDGGFFLYRLYRDSTEIGKRHKAENGGTSSQNFVFAITFIDTPSAGTNTYAIKAYQGSGTHVFGEDWDVEGAVITACELLWV